MPILLLVLLAAPAPSINRSPTGEQCFAWTRDATGVDPNGAPATQGDDSVRFSRGYQACLSSVGYEVPPPNGIVQQPPSILVVGQPVAFKPPVLPVSVICDDVSVVRVDDAGTFLWLTGVKPGETSCSFGAAVHAGRRALYHFVVQAASR